MRPRLLLAIDCKFAVDFFARGLHTRTAVARLPLRQLGFLVGFSVQIANVCCSDISALDFCGWFSKMLSISTAYYSTN